jgi:hypothetical protein
MRKILFLVTLGLVFCSVALAETALQPTDNYGAQVIVNQGTPAAAKSGADDIQVTCSAQVDKNVLKVSWEIRNPHRKVLTIRPADMRFRDQVRELDQLEPVQVAEMSYEGQSQGPVDPFMSPTAPPDYREPQLAKRSPAEEELYANAFGFGKTNSGKFGGMTYYRWHGREGLPLVAELALNEETYRFEFK